MEKELTIGYIIFGILLNLKVTNCITCFHCNGASTVKGCMGSDSIVKCLPNQACYMEKRVNLENGLNQFYGGCRDMELCVLDHCQKMVFGDAHSRSLLDMLQVPVCSDCCYDDICNVNLCGANATVEPTNVTQCFNCKGIKDEELCTTTIDCDLKLYSCLVEKNTDNTIHLGCMYTRQCNFLLTVPEVSSETRCCQTHLCNGNPKIPKLDKNEIFKNFSCPTGLAHPTTTKASLPPTSNPASASTLKPTPAATSPTLPPTSNPTSASTLKPTPAATSSPTLPPTSNPTSASTLKPTPAATSSPTLPPTSNPTSASTLKPTPAATSSPTLPPTSNPTSASTLKPTPAATSSPTLPPTSNPTSASTLKPMPAATSSPTLQPASNPAIPTTPEPTPAATPSTPTTALLPITTIVSSTQPPPKTLPPVTTSCAVCAGPAFLCEKLFAPTPCPAPENYCINSVINHKDGTRTVDRKCGDFDTCYREWFQGSSDDDKCRKFNEDEEQRLDFQCTFCCVTDDCNIPLRPDAASLYKPA